MKTTEEYRGLAKERFAAAQHILTVTYPALKSPRLFVSAVEHLFLAMDYAMNALLADGRLRGMAGEFPRSFSGRYSAFRFRLADRLGFDRKGVEALLALRNILAGRRKSPVEFERADAFIICTNDYETTVLSRGQVAEYAKAAGSFIAAAEDILNQPVPRYDAITPHG